MTEQVQGFLNFIDKATSTFHAVDTMVKQLEEKGFKRLYEHEEWKLVPGGKYYVTRNLSSIMAFAVPEDGFTHFQIVASHSDSPTFKLKPTCENSVCERFVRLNIEKYGGMVMHTWLDRPLSIAGRVVLREGGKLTTKLVDLRKTIMIPNVAAHLNRQLNDGFKYNPQVDMQPMYGDITAKGKLMEDIAEAAGVEADKIVTCDLSLYCAEPGVVWGRDDVYFSCSRIDDLECAYTSFVGFVEAEAKGHVNVVAVFDNEEVGSTSKQGAASTFLTDTLMRTAAAFGMTDAQARAAIVSSFMVSADNAHSVHPNHPELYDAQNRTYMNEGVVIKHSPNQKYTSDAISDAVFSMICERAGVPVQHFSNRSDMIGGSTLGNISNTHASMNTVDIGLPQLAMHSCYETAGCKDVAYMIDALREFYNTNIVTEADGSYSL